MTDQSFLVDIWRGLGGNAALLAQVEMAGEGALPSVFAVSDLAAGSVGACGLAIAELLSAAGQPARGVRVDRRLASLWYGTTLRPDGWSLPPAWDPVAGDYQAADGWIRLHTNAPHHRAAALRVLNVRPERAAVAAAVARWQADALESAVVAANGCAAAMRGLDDWAAHDQGAAVAREPLVCIEETDAAAGKWSVQGNRPLRGIKVLDLTRVLAGPVSTRLLAGFGAEVLRIDPPSWDEPGVIPEVTLGKTCARLDLRQPEGLARLRALLARADVLVHGYRPDALPQLGLDAATRRSIRPGLIDVSLDAYGWSGPWQGRRGFDSLVQMSSGIAAEGMRRLGGGKPRPLPVQALDHATGYLMAAAVLRGLTRRLTRGVGSRARFSLARTAALLTAAPARHADAEFIQAADADYAAQIEATAWGPAARMKPPLDIAGCPMRWDLPAGALGASEAAWRDGV